MNTLRTAEAGDICILLVPDADERLDLRREQESLVRLYGGWVVPEPHITLQRFRIDRRKRSDTGSLTADPEIMVSLNSVIIGVQAAFSDVAPFTVRASRITQFLAPFWGAYVLRWEVQCDDRWRQLIDTLDMVLRGAGCELHYDHSITPTCSAVDLTHQIQLDDEPTFTFPRDLFTARRVLFTGVLGANDFETLGMAKIGK